MSLVLITQIGFVTIVEHAPAVTEAYPRDNHQLPVTESVFGRLNLSIQEVLTCLVIKVFPSSVVDRQINSPSGKIAQ